MRQIRDAVYLIKYRNVHKAIKDKVGKANKCENVANKGIELLNQLSIESVNKVT